MSKSYSRRDQDAYSGRDHRWGKSQSSLHRSRSKDRSQYYHSRDRDQHPHHRESRASPLGRKDSLLAFFSSYEEYMDYFNRFSSSNQDLFPTPQDRDSFLDTLQQRGRSYKDAQYMPRIPRHSRDFPLLQASTPSAALGTDFIGRTATLFSLLGLGAGELSSESEASING